MILPTSWGAPETYSWSMMCTWCLSIWTTNFLLLLSGNTLKLYELGKPRPFQQLYTHLNATTQSTMKVNLAAPVMTHTITASLCTLCYELYSIVKAVANENNES
jgi:hypothetical protein